MQASQFVRLARTGAGLSQATLANRLGVTQPVISRLERAGSNPRVSTLRDIAAATGHTLELGLAAGSGLDETLIAADLERTPEARLRNFESAYRFAREFGGATVRGS